jgi:hypothetical protein
VIPFQAVSIPGFFSSFSDLGVFYDDGDELSYIHDAFSEYVAFIRNPDLEIFRLRL